MYERKHRRWGRAQSPRNVVLVEVKYFGEWLLLSYPGGSWNSNSCQSWWQVSLPPGPSHKAFISLLIW